MMQVKEAIEARRSIRKFKPQKIEEVQLQELLDAARRAPSGHNTQPWRFIVIEDLAKRDQLSVLCHEQRWMAKAPLFVVACADLSIRAGSNSAFDEETPGMDAKRVIRDTAIAVDHLMLRAVDMGLGSCWIGWYEQSDIRLLLQIPEHVFVLGVILIGYPDESPQARPRKALEDLVFRERWGNAYF